LGETVSTLARESRQDYVRERCGKFLLSNSPFRGDESRYSGAKEVNSGTHIRSSEILSKMSVMCFDYSCFQSIFLGCYDRMDFMNGWYVRLQGRKYDLQELPRLFSLPDARVCEQDGVYILKSEKFSKVEEASEVLGIATHILELVHGVAKITLGDFEAVKADAVWKLDEEGREHWAKFLSTTVTARASMNKLSTVLKANDAIDSGQSSPLSNSRLSAALHHDDIAKALHFIREPSWRNLWKVYEIIKDAVGGIKGIVQAGWATRGDLSLFSQTAQSDKALGDAARHAAKKYKAPEDPMSLSRASKLITDLLRYWIDGYGQ